MKHKILPVLLLFSALICNQAKANETEPNDTKAQANTLALNGNNTGSIGTATDVDWWKVTTTGDGSINLTLTVSNGLYTWFVLYDNNGTTLLHQDYNNGTSSYSVDGLAKGTYYIKIFAYTAGQLPAYTISNTLTQPVQANDAEPDSTRSQALVLPLNGSKTGHISYYYQNHRDSADWYKVTTNADGKLRIRIASANGQYVWAYLFDNNGITQLNADDTNVSTDINTDGLAAGTYYVKIITYYTDGFAPYTVSDSLFKPSEANDAEPNNTKATALTLPLNGSVKGHSDYYYNNLRDSSDWYKVTTNGDGRLRLTIKSGNGQYVWAYLFDNDGTTQLNADNTNSSLDINTDGLAAGTYYVRVNTYYNTGFVPYTLNDSLFKPVQANDTEPNDSKATAQTLGVNSSVTGHSDYYYNHHRDSADWYKITIPSDGLLRLRITSPNGQYIWAYLFDNDGTTQLNANNTNSSVDIKTDGLAAGTYYVRVNSYYNTGFAPYTLQDSLFTYSYTADIEPNKYAAKAATLPANTLTTGHVGFYYKNVRDSVDWWKVNYTGNGPLKLNVTENTWLSDGSQHYYWFQVYKDTNSAPIYSQDFLGASGDINLSSLTKGYYYIKIYAFYNSEFISYSITPTFTQSKAKIVTLSYDTAASCSSTNTITYKLSASHAPYSVQLYRFGIAYGTPLISKNTKAIFSNLPSGSYYATVYADGATGTAKGKSDTISIIPSPVGPNTTNITAVQAKLNWTAVPCADYYLIQYHKSGSLTWDTVHTTGNVTNYLLKGLIASTTYNWQVAAVDSENHISAISLFTNAVSFKTKASAGFAEAGSGEQDNLSIENNKLKNGSFIIAPNPASSYFIIHHNISGQEKLIATLYDVNGKAIWASGSITADALNNKQVMVNRFGSGFYYLKITNSQGLVIGTIKVVISK